MSEFNPVASLFRSRKFLLLLLDTFLSLILYFVGRYAGGELAEDVKYVIAAMQPVFVAIIIAISVEDAAEKSRRARE